MANTITITGNLTRDPELRFTQAGRPVCSFGVADEHRFMQNGEWQSEVTFHNVTVWGDQAQNVAASLTKGATVIIEGRLKSRTYEAEGGEKRTAFDIIANNVGASLRWATATIERTHSSGTGQSATRSHSDPIYGDEEPFVSLYTGHHSYANMALIEPWL